METVKARKQGNSIMITLSSKLDVAEGEEFISYKDSRGVIHLIPKVKDYFLTARSGDFTGDKDAELVQNFVIQESEMDDW